MIGAQVKRKTFGVTGMEGEMAVVALVGGVAIGVGLLIAAAWVWRWDPSPGSGLAFFPAAHVAGYSKAISVGLAVVGVAWLVLLLRASF